MESPCPFRWELATDRVRVGKRALALLNLPEMPAPSMADLFSQVEPGQRAEVERTLAAARRDHGDLDLTVRIPLASGGVRTVWIGAQPLAGEHGEPVLAGVILQTIQHGTGTGDDQDFHLTLDQAPGLIWSALPDGYVDFLNMRWLEYTGTRLEETCGWGWQSTIHPDDLPPLLAIWQGLLATGQAGDAKARLRRGDGVYRWHLFRATPYHDEGGRVVKWYGQTVDIEDLKRAENLLSAERSILEMLNQSASLADTLDATCRMVDAMLPGCVSSVWLLDGAGQHVADVFAPGLPPAFIDGLTTLIGDTGGGKMSLYAGPCASAIQRRATVVIPDLSASTGWKEYCALALRFGFRSVVCTPVASADGAILGMFVLQSLSAGEPTDHQRSVVEHFTHMTAMAAERKRVDAALRDSEERFRLMAETSPDVIWITDLHPERVLYCSPSFERLWGHAVEALYADPRLWTAVIHPDDVGRVVETFTRGIEANGGSQYSLEFRLLRADGSVRWISERAVFIADGAGRPHRVSGISTDITQRKLAEAALFDSQERFRLAVSASSDGIWDCDLTTGMMYMSEQAQAIHGLPVGETLRPRAEWSRRFRFHPGDVGTAEEAIEGCIAGSVPSFTGDWRIVNDDGSFRWVRVRGRCMRDAGGRAIRLAGAITDIDIQKRTEHALQQSRRLEAMGTLAGGIAHDFNNILGIILGYAEMALRGTTQGSRLRRDLDSIVSAGGRGRALVDRILAFSRSGSNEQIPVAVQAVVNESIALISATLPANLRIFARLEAERAAMMGDPTQVHQVVMNLLTNAIQAMPSGGEIVVSLELVWVPSPHVTTTAVLAAGQYLRLQVEDHGTGIPADIVDRIFDPFFTTKDVGVGTGLGLSLVHGIVLDLGGGVDVSTAAGKGSVFAVYLPYCGEVPAGESDGASSLPHGTGERVLVVDDEEPLLRVSEEALLQLGYRPRAFLSSIAAFQAFATDPEGFDVVLTDERMPGMTGSALIAAIRELRPEIPVMLMSGYFGELSARQFAVPVLRKPFTRHELASGLASLKESVR